MSNSNLDASYGEDRHNDLVSGRRKPFRFGDPGETKATRRRTEAITAFPGLRWRTAKDSNLRR